MVAVVGLAVDLGRMYIVRNEAQAYADSVAMKAALELDGTPAGLARARTAVAAATNRWHFGNSSFAGTLLDFGATANGAWSPNPAFATGLMFARVRATTNPPLYFMPIVGQSSRGVVRAAAIAGQIPKMGFREGSFPFSPMAHDASDPNFGLIRGFHYTLRWAASPRLHHNNVCYGDDGGWVVAAATASGEERGYIEETSSDLIREAIEGDYQTRPLEVGDTVTMTGGTKQTQQDSLINRVLQDTDSVSWTYAEYVAQGTGNGRRLVFVPINTWSPEYRVVGFAAFFLRVPSIYQTATGGNKPFCAEYVGPYVQGSSHQGAGGAAGVYVVRLVQ
jgi:hypothetical protein